MKLDFKVIVLCVGGTLGPAAMALAADNVLRMRRSARSSIRWRRLAEASADESIRALHPIHLNILCLG
jgi:hypothetical protein